MNMNMNKSSRAFGHAASGLFIAMALTASARAESRGQLLYAAHCIACHTTQMHWREQRVATDWTRLKAEVRRWQGTAALNWSEGDIVEVARHLNESIYRYPQTADPLANLRGDIVPVLRGGPAPALLADARVVLRAEAARRDGTQLNTSRSWHQDR